MKLLYSHSTEGWRRYALRMLAYGRALADMGLPFGHPERERVRRSYRAARNKMYAEQRRIDAAGRLIAVTKKAPQTGRGRRNQ